MIGLEFFDSKPAVSQRVQAVDDMLMLDSEFCVRRFGKGWHWDYQYHHQQIWLVTRASMQHVTTACLSSTYMPSHKPCTHTFIQSWSCHVMDIQQYNNTLINTTSNYVVTKTSSAVTTSTATILELIHYFSVCTGHHSVIANVTAYQTSDTLKLMLCTAYVPDFARTFFGCRYQQAINRL